MAILETAIMFEGETMIEKQFYSTENVLDRHIRNSLLQAISGLASSAFNDEVRSFTIGDYTIVLMTHDLLFPEKIPLTMYCIVEKKTDEKAIQKGMVDALFQFQNRFSLNDISAKKKRKFKNFPKRLDSIFKDLILKSEDRFKLLF